MKNKPLVIYHGNCQDGFTAAWACWTVHPDWEFYPGKHGDAPPDVTRRQVFMVDFSYKKPVLLDMMQQAVRITILDHHKTAEDDLSSLPFDPEATKTNCLLEVRFDMEKSGAHLAWNYFHQNEDLPEIVKYVEDRDLWKFKYPETKEISAFLFSKPYDFEIWDRLAEALTLHVKGIREAGKAILDKQQKDTEELLQNKFRINIGGHDVWTVNLPYTFSSDAGHVLGENEPFGSTYYFDGNNYIFSLRSREDGLDVSEIAKMYGGGGHKHAAGFRVGITQMFPIYVNGKLTHKIV